MKASKALATAVVTAALATSITSFRSTLAAAPISKGIEDSMAISLSSYDTLVLSHRPVAYWPFTSRSGSDVSGHGLNGSFAGSPTSVKMPNGDTAIAYNGIDQYFSVSDNSYLEIRRTGVLTVEAWMRPDVLQFSDWESSGYVHWMGKGGSGQHAYVARIYNRTNEAERPNRISGYAFNLDGGLGAGSYFQDTVRTGHWIHYVLVLNTNKRTSAYPTGYTKIFKSGVLRDQDSLKDYNIVPGNGKAPFRVGTYSLASFFQGAVGKVAVYDYELTPAQIAAHYKAMGSPAP